MISYDLKSENHDYTEMYEKIKEIGDWYHPLESLWFVVSDSLATDIYHRLENVKGDKDNILVMELQPKNRQGWMPRSFWDWIKEKS